VPTVQVLYAVFVLVEVKFYAICPLQCPPCKSEGVSSCDSARYCSVTVYHCPFFFKLITKAITFSFFAKLCSTLSCVHLVRARVVFKC